MTLSRTPSPGGRWSIGPRAAAASAMGPRHAANEDRTFLPDDVPWSAVLTHGWLYALADGVSRSAGGAYASQLAIGALAEAIYRGTSHAGAAASGTPAAAASSASASPRTAARPSGDDELRRAFAAAQASVRQAAQSAGPGGLACTLVAVLLRDDGGWVASVGDSRVYRVRDGRSEQLTVDHTVAAALLERAAIDEATAEAHPGRKMLARAIGADDATPDVVRIRRLRPGERLVLVSDGVTDVLGDAEVIQAVSDMSAANAAAGTLAAARARGLVDDTTVLVVAPAGPLISVATRLLGLLWWPRQRWAALGLAAGVVVAAGVLGAGMQRVPPVGSVIKRLGMPQTALAVASPEVSKAERDCLAADVDGNGRVDRADWTAVNDALRVAAVSKSIAKPPFDVDGDGVLSNRDTVFVDAMIINCRVSTPTTPEDAP